MSLPSKKLPDLSSRISLISDKFCKTSLRAASKYLTDLALRHIVEYILELEGKDG